MTHSNKQAMRKFGSPCLTAVLCIWSCTIAVAPVYAEDLADDTHWAFRPIERPTPPTVKRTDLVLTPVDAFILQKLEGASLEPSAVADKRTLIRRATYDLIGLPPTADEVADFLADESPQAFATLVERLLASPHYGERWGRYWLDVARYANTRGDTGTDNNTHPFAYTYRDYVVRALNDDLPYDQFLIEQIAADQLPQSQNSPALAALGFITVGRHFLNNIHDTIDDRIDVATRGTMALTVSCARCHDHKYDPIPTKDYYSLYGVFASSNEPAQLPAIGASDPAAAADYEAQRQKLETARTELTRQHQAEILQRHRKLTSEYLLASRREPNRQKPDQAAPAAAEKSIRRAGARRWRQALEKLNPETDAIFAPWFAFAAIPESEFPERARELAAKVASNGMPHPINGLVVQAFAGEPPASLKDVAERYGNLLEEVAKPASAATVNLTETAESPDRQALRKALLEGDAPGNLPDDAVRKLFPDNIQAQLQQFGNELAKLETEHAGAPRRAMVLYDNPQPHNPRVFIRGNANNPGDEVPRQFLDVLAGKNRQPFATGSGRLELARSIASVQNPLTARVIVNRVWMHHFGEGLVTTPDDFGLRSDPPSHPQLLDYLAARFMDEGWSLKKLHRLLMLSRVYMQISDDGLRSETVDPENRLLSKMNRRRLDFEAMRDSLLLIAGNLDRTIGGRAVPLTSQPPVSAAGIFSGPATEQPTAKRRAIYAHIDRQNLPGLFRVFDFADPDTSTGRRYVTTVPQQALFFFNNQFVMEQARSLVSRPEFLGLTTSDERIRDLYQQAFQRAPAADELDLARQFVANGQAANATPSEQPPAAGAAGNNQSPQAWELLAHVLLMADELMFVD